MSIDFKEALTPYWKGDNIYNETVMFIEDGRDEAKLLYQPEKIISVTDAHLKLKFIEDIDYIVTPDGLKRTKNSSIPLLTKDIIFPAQHDKAHCFYMLNGGNVFFSETSFFHDRQIAVTYKAHKPVETNDFYQPQKLSRFLDKIHKQAKLNVLFFGDSYIEGGNASKTIMAEPYMPAYPELTTIGLNLFSQVSEFNYSIVAKGGQTSDWGAENIKAAVDSINPDLIVITFGGNDGTWSLPFDRFKSNYIKMIDCIRAKNPDCGIILTSTLLPNPDACMKTDDGTVIPFVGLQEQYTPILEQLSKECNVAFVDVMKGQKTFLNRKKYYDMLSNFINHPNDFLHRYYAQCLLSCILGDY